MRSIHSRAIDSSTSASIRSVKTSKQRFRQVVRRRRRGPLAQLLDHGVQLVELTGDLVAEVVAVLAAVVDFEVGLRDRGR